MSHDSPTFLRSDPATAGLGWLLPSNKSGLPLARQEFASFGPQNLTTFTPLSCFMNALKRAAYASACLRSASLTKPPCVVAALLAMFGQILVLSAVSR